MSEKSLKKDNAETREATDNAGPACVNTTQTNSNMLQTCHNKSQVSQSGKEDCPAKPVPDASFKSPSFTGWRDKSSQSKSQPADVTRLKYLLSQKQKTLNSIDKKWLPDGGERLVEQIKNLKLEINQEEEKEKKEIGEKPTSAPALVEKTANVPTPVVWAGPPTVNVEVPVSSTLKNTNVPPLAKKVVWAGPPSFNNHRLNELKPAPHRVGVSTDNLKPPHMEPHAMEHKENSFASGQERRETKYTVPHSYRGYEDLWSDRSNPHSYYGGRMTNSRLVQVQTVTEESVIKLHKSLDGCPGPEVLALDPSKLKSSLMPHQRQALAWLLWRETQEPPGGVLADDMGLGKTLTLIALVLKKQHCEDVQTVAQQQQGWLSKKGLTKSGGTLVVCPASLLLQWEKEVNVHCQPDTLKVHLYHGSNREKDSLKLSSYDMVITTYSILTKEIGDWNEEKEGNDFSKAPTLLRVVWERVILDEAHAIKNHKSKCCHAVCLLRATYRWALTGTPIHNDLMDMYALLRFLRVTPFDELKVWKKWVDNKTSMGKERLGTLIKSLLLRRTKDQLDFSGKPLVHLPTKRFVSHEISLSPKERDVYDELYKQFKSTLNNMLLRKAGDTCGSNKDGGRKNQALLFTLLLRLQQTCCHLSLLIQEAKESDETDADVLADQLTSLSLENQSNKPKDIEDLFGLAKYREDNDFDKTSQSVKVSALLEELKEVIKLKDKCVIVSQWTSMLKIVAHQLNSLNVPYALIQGGVSFKNRMTNIDNFNNASHELQVILLSLKAGGVGLNLTGGNHLFLVDVHWNPALEQQACDRVFRVGQTKDVTIHRFICKGTVEEKVLELQASKLQLAKSVLNYENISTHLTLNDLKNLFCM